MHHLSHIHVNHHPSCLVGTLLLLLPALENLKIPCRQGVMKSKDVASWIFFFCRCQQIFWWYQRTSLWSLFKSAHTNLLQLCALKLSHGYKLLVIACPLWRRRGWKLFMTRWTTGSKFFTRYQISLIACISERKFTHIWENCSIYCKVEKHSLLYWTLMNFRC